MKDFENELKRLIELIKAKRMVVFCGAGISFNSGVPTVIGIIKYILGKFKLSEAEINIILESGLPFESFMANLVDNSDLKVIASLMKIFAIGKPNLNHILLSELIKKGIVNNIVTTNFDCLIEDALYPANTSRQVYLDDLSLGNELWKNAPGIIQDSWQKNIFFEIEGFKRVDWNLKNIIKVHGSIALLPSLITTIEMIASKAIVGSRLEVIKHTFSEGKHEGVLVLGYSFSDVFDIVPEIQSITDGKEIFVVDHSSDSQAVEDIAIKEFKNPLGNYKGVRFYCDTGLVVKRIWTEVIEVNFPVIPVDSSADWKKLIDHWFSLFDKNPCTKFLFLGNTFNDISRSGLAEKYLSEGLNVAKANNKSLDRGQILISICNVKRREGKYEDALSLAEEAIKIARKSKSEIGELQCLGTIGFCHRNLGNYPMAIQYHLRELQIAKKLKNNTEISKALGGLAMVFHKMQAFDKAVEIFQEQIKLGYNSGDINLVGNAAGNLAMAYERLGLIPEATKYYYLALDIAEKLGDIKLKVNNLVGAARYEDKNNGMKLLDEATSLAEQVDSEFLKAYVKSSKGILLINNGDLSGKSLLYEGSQRLKQILDSSNPILAVIEDNIAKMKM